MTKILLLYDEISPASAKTFVSEITKLSPTADVTIAVNSPGGNVSAGDAIAAAIDRHKGTTTCRIDGVAASAASYIAMFCDRIIMACGSFMMIHRPFVTMVGTADDLTTTAVTLRAIEARYCSAYSLRSGQDAARVREMMVKETWLSAAQAVEQGFADEVDGTLARATTVSKRVLQYAHVPQEIAAMAKGAQGSGRDKARRDRLRKRLMIVATQARFNGRDPKRDEEDRARGERMRRRAEMQATVDAVKAEARKEEAQERAAIKEQQRQNYYYNWHGMPRGPR